MFNLFVCHLRSNMKNQQKMNERELALGMTGTSSSWHSQYDDSAWVFAGGLPFDLTEGDVICIFSQLVLCLITVHWTLF